MPFETQIANALGRPLRRNERKFVSSVEALFQRWSQSRHLADWDINTLLPEWSIRNYKDLALWPNPPRDAAEFWRYIVYAAEERGVPTPGFMKPLEETPSSGMSATEWKRQRQITRWRETMEDFGHRNALVEPPIDFRLVILPGKAQLEWKRVEDPAFRPMKSATMKTLLDRFEAGLLPVVPEAQALWQFFVHNEHRYPFNNLSLKSIQLRKALNPILRVPCLGCRIVNEAGNPFLRPTEPLRVRARETDSGDYLIEWLDADGQPRSGLLPFPGAPTLHLSPVEIFIGPPNWDVDSSEPVCIPAEALETPEGLDFLGKLGAEPPPRLQARMKSASMEVVIRCRLDSLFPGAATEGFFAVVEASASDGSRREFFTKNGWQVAADAAEEDGNIVSFDRSAMAGFPALLETLGCAWDPVSARWKLRVTKAFPERFVEWAEQLPSGIRLEAEGELSTLLSGPVNASVRIECEQDGIDWFNLKVIVNVSDTELTDAELKALLDARGGYVRLEGKGWRRLHFALTEEDKRSIAELGLSPEDFSSEPKRLHVLQLAGSGANARSALPPAQLDKIRKRVAELKTEIQPPVPTAIRAELRPYQIEGFHFLAYLSANRFGGILADDMGLGKTLQTLTWLAWAREESIRADGHARPSLVVCPKSVMDNWKSEAARFLPELRVSGWDGSDAEELESRLAKLDLLIINYTQMRTLSELLPKIPWLAAILDEGQYIKNPESQTAQAARELNALHRIALTGTPIENRLLDLWSLMSFAMPGVLGNRADFARRFDETADPLARQRLAACVRPFLIRRTKTQVAPELPDRSEEDLLCEMEGEQKTLYQAELKRAQRALLKIATKRQLDKERFNILTSLLRLRQICCHPALLASPVDSVTGKPVAELEVAPTGDSAKLTALIELLEPLVDEGHKVLVFSQFVSMLDIVRTEVEARGWKHFYLTGSSEDRGALVKGFQATEGAALFLISLKAGGFGLNLTAASYVILFDPWWNPAVENQAIDRTHRIGQTSKVLAYRLLIKDSVEQKIRDLQKRKSTLAQDVLGEESFTKALTLEDFRFLFEAQM